jgi:hypothetical protein
MDEGVEGKILDQETVSSMCQGGAQAGDGFVDKNPKGVTEQVAFDVAQGIITTSPALTHLSADLALASFCPEGFIGIGVSIVTDIFVRDFVAKTCRDIIP